MDTTQEIPPRNSISEGCSCSQDLALKLEKDYVPTVAVELVVWPVWQLYTFRHVPLQHQLMTSNLLTLGRKCLSCHRLPSKIDLNFTFLE